MGEPLARMEMFLYLSAIIQNFNISAAPGDDLSLKNMDSFGFTHVPMPYRIVASLRDEMPIRHFSLLNVNFAGACGYDFVCDGRRLVRAYLRRRRGEI